jgi:hypothetical protein
MNPREHGEEAYREWIRATSPVFSPFTCLREPVVLQGYVFWTVEALWLGSRVLRVRDLARVVAPAEPVVVCEEDGWNLCFFPHVGALKLSLPELHRHPVMRLLRPSRAYQGKRNALLGIGNWALDERSRSWSLVSSRLLPEPAAYAELAVPYYLEQLRQYGDEVARLRELQARGVGLLTEELMHTHCHLRVLNDLLAGRLAAG